jgi:hypothetical protein
MSLFTGALAPLQAGGGGTLESLLSLAFLAVVIAGAWKTFEKAGEPGWAAVIPLYNLWVMVRISDNAWWWFALLFVPLVQLIAVIKVSLDIARKFGQGILFGVGLWLIPIVFWPLLGFGDYRYRGGSTL